MKKITAILFLFSYPFHTLGFNELFKINVLIEHYHETQNNQPFLSLNEFLIMHYITDDLNDKDDDRDRQLPFKSSNSYISVSTTFYMAYHNIPSLHPKSFANTKPDKLITKYLISDIDFNSNIWHPPKKSWLVF